MKIYLMMIQIAVFLLGFTACSSDETQDEQQEINETKYDEEIIGVWSDGKYFVSFGSDGYYSAYIADDFIDCGKYTISNVSNNGEYKTDNFFGNTFGIDIVVSNYFSDIDTYLSISELTESTMKIAARYTIRYPYKSDYRSLTLTKTDNQPTIENHHYIGYSYSEKCTIDGHDATVTTTLSANNIGKMTADYEEVSRFPISLHYVYLGDTIYYQKKIPNRQLEGLPIWYGWNDDDTGTVLLHTCN